MRVIGETISHYKVLEKLGEGGMGVVYKAEDLKLKRTVALKFLHQHRLGSDRDRVRFIHEAQAAAALDHPNICTVHEIVDTPEHTFIVMNYIAGRTLAQIVESGSLDFAAAVDYATQIAEGLEAAHEKGIIHRDIKSANVMVTEAGRAKITDFGLARLPDRTRVTRDETTVGTATYMSPEQLSGGEVGRQSDVWSLGVVLYEMLAGRLPFRGEYDSAVIYSISNREPEPLSSIRPDTPAALEQVVSKALTKKKEDRYRDAGEMLVDLRAVETAMRTGEELPVGSIPGASVSRRDGVLRRAARRRVAWVAAAAVIVIAGAAILFYPRGAVPFAARDWVVIADFENLTGKAVMDRSLDMALSVSLDQSPYMNVFPRRRAEEALQRMKKKDVERIDAKTAREIAVREGVRILVVPAITGVGEEYALTAIIQDAESGETFRSEMVKANGEGEVLPALDELAKRIRGDLGEAKRSISQKSKPLERVTTPSLAGLQQYTMGFDMQRRAKFDEAKRHYEYALESDSTFAIALGALGMLEYQFFDQAMGVHHLNRALQYADQTTEPEGYSIRAAHAVAVGHDLEKAAQIYRMAVESYPDASANHNNLGAVYGMLGRHQDAVRHYQEAIRTEPTMMIAYNGLVVEYMDRMGRIDSALVWLRRQMLYEPQSPWPYQNLACAYVGADSLDQAVTALGRAIELDPGFDPGMELLGKVLRLQGRYRESLGAFERMQRADKEQPEALYNIGVVCEMMGNQTKARESYERCRRIVQTRAEENPDDVVSAIGLATVLTRLGRASAAGAAEERAAAIDSTSYAQWTRLRAVQGRVDEALVLLQRAIDGGFRDFVLLKIEADFETLRADLRFAPLVERYLVK